MTARCCACGQPRVMMNGRTNLAALSLVAEPTIWICRKCSADAGCAWSDKAKGEGWAMQREPQGKKP